MTFSDGGTSLGTASLSGSGQATLVATSSVIDTVGTHTITASYSGDTNFTGSSNSVLQTVSAASTSTTVTSSTTASVFGQSVTFTATVSPQVAGTFDSGGTVTFSDGSTSLGTASLSGGQATLAATAAVINAVGTHTITASYSGDTNFSGSSSDSVLQTVTTFWSCNAGLFQRQQRGHPLCGPGPGQQRQPVRHNLPERSEWLRHGVRGGGRQRHHHHAGHFQRHQRGQPCCGPGPRTAAATCSAQLTMAGRSGDGTVFELAAGSGTITTLATFNGTNGANP